MCNKTIHVCALSSEILRAILDTKKANRDRVKKGGGGQRRSRKN